MVNKGGRHVADIVIAKVHHPARRVSRWRKLRRWFKGVFSKN